MAGFALTVRVKDRRKPSILFRKGECGMLIWEKTGPDNAWRELALRNTDPFYNRVAEGKEELTLADIEEDRRKGDSLGAERYLLRRDGEDVGVLDILDRNPSDGYSWLGLLFIARPFRSQGLARAALAGYWAQMSARGFTVCRLGVVEGNEPGSRFWQSQGFVKVRRSALANGKPVDVYERMIDDDFVSSADGR